LIHQARHWIGSFYLQLMARTLWSSLPAPEKIALPCAKRFARTSISLDRSGSGKESHTGWKRIPYQRCRISR